MAKLVHVSREQAEKGRRNLEELLAEDEFWRAERRRIKQFEETEKIRRDTEERRSRRPQNDA